MKFIFSLFLGILTFGSAQARFAIQNEINLQEIEGELDPFQIIALNTNKFVLLDRSNNELILIEGLKLKNRIGGFGLGEDSFADPVDLINHKLQVRVCDRYNNSVKRFDLQLNYIGTEQISQAEYESFFPDLMIPDPFGSELVLSKDFGILLNVEEQNIPVVDLNQYGISGECIIDLASDKEGNFTLLSCNAELLQFNRFGRKLRSIAIDITDPFIVLNGINDWMVLNKDGAMQSKLYKILMIQLEEGEEIISADTHFQHVILLTNTRILVLK